VDDKIDETSDISKKKSMIIKLNEIAYTELILLIYVKASSGKVAFNIIRGCKTKDYRDGNGAIAWKRLKNKYEPVSAPSMVN
jgi:tmRNA-binding protein